MAQASGAKRDRRLVYSGERYSKGEINIRESWKAIQFALAGLGAWLGWFLGGSDGLIYALVAFVTIDYITGVMRAIVQKRLSSEVGARGIFKKVFVFALVGIGHIVDDYILGGSSAFRTAVIFFYLSNEGLSILENAVAIGLPVPERLSLVLRQLRSEGGKDHGSKQTFPDSE